jgi:putative ABC transport system permease protein
LVTIQFAVSLVFLIGTLVSIKQVQHLFTKDTGLNYHSKVAVKMSRLELSVKVFHDKTNVFSDKLIQIPGIKKITITSDIPGQDISVFFSCYRKGMSPGDLKDYFRTDVDSAFLDFYGAKLIAGRFFNSFDREEMNYILLNVSAMKRLGYNKPQEALDQIVKRDTIEWKIIGVLSDFNFMTLKVVPVPTFFTLTVKNKRYVCFDFSDPKQSGYLMDRIREEYTAMFPGVPFEYHYLDDKVGAELKSDKTVAAEFTLFAILAIVIAVIGMLGLIIITVNRNIKEMGVRKTLGASQSNIALLLAKHFIWELAIAIIFVIPLSLVGYKRWFLNNYVYPIQLEWWFFIVPIAILCLLLLAVIVIMSRKVWKLNPTEALRYE